MQQCLAALWSVKQSSFHFDEVINDKPLLWPSVTHTSLFTLHLAGLALSSLHAVQLSVPSESRCHFSDPAESAAFWPSVAFTFMTSFSPSHLPGEELGVVPSHESHVSSEQRGRQWAEWDALSAGETGQHCHSGGSAVWPAGWAQGTGKVLPHAVFHGAVGNSSALSTAVDQTGSLMIEAKPNDQGSRAPLKATVFQSWKTHGCQEGRQNLLENLALSLKNFQTCSYFPVRAPQV